MKAETTGPAMKYIAIAIELISAANASAKLRSFAISSSKLPNVNAIPSKIKILRNAQSTTTQPQDPSSARVSQEQSRDTHKTLYDCWERKRMKASEQINDDVSTSTAGVTEAIH
ncbi:hypothetical protein EVAR_78480_1 [Eumeta japonica]|uniref:Uncharacterized protein n=1 Tax=Eumeta variegata TaxID=151549 RepID=A0A4C1TY76_EUMVA|nr:hypothetical protein EVAR_78480_1 [Eumeta japonica]